MIRFEFTELEDGLYYWLSPILSVSTYGTGAATPPIDAARPMLVVSPTNDQPTSFQERSAGSRPVHGDKVVGTMRDKEVQHLNAAGTIYLPSSTFAVSEHSTWGYSQFYDSTSLVWRNAAIPPIKWKEVASFTRALPSYDYLSGSELRTVATAYGEWFAYWTDDGEYLIIITEAHNPLVVRKSDGLVRIPASSRGCFTAYKRVQIGDSFVLRYSPSATSYKTGAFFSGQEKLALCAALSSITTWGTSTTKNFLRSQNSSSQETVADILIEDIRSHTSDTHLHLDEHPADFGELGLECSAQLKFVDQNVLLLAVDVDDWVHIHRLWKNLSNSYGWKQALKAYNRIKKGRGKFSDIPKLFTPGSSTYLFGKYAVLPAVSDIRRLMDGARRSTLYTSRKRLHSRKVTSIDDSTASWARHTAVLTVQCSSYPSDILGANQWFIGEMKKWGVFPELQNLWDILPYSFVVDWFVQFGDLFEDVDAWLYQKHYFPIDYCVMSEKWEVSRSINSIAPQNYGATGEVVFSYYTRWISRMLPLPTVSLEAESALGKHLVESTALIMQRL